MRVIPTAVLGDRSPFTGVYQDDDVLDRVFEKMGLPFDLFDVDTQVAATCLADFLLQRAISSTPSSPIGTYEACLALLDDESGPVFSARVKSLVSKWGSHIEIVEADSFVPSERSALRGFQLAVNAFSSSDTDTIVIEMGKGDAERTFFWSSSLDMEMSVELLPSANGDSTSVKSSG